MVPVEGPLGAPAETRLDLRPALTGALGQVVALVEPDSAVPTEAQRGWENRPLAVWVQATRIGLVGYADGDSVLGWATSLVNGAPLAGTTLTLLGGSAATQTDPKGIGRFRGAPTGGHPGPLVARRGADLAILPGWWGRHERMESLFWYLFTDRGLYRPGEEVRARGWIRRRPGQGGDPELPGRGMGAVQYTVVDPREAEIARGTAELDSVGGFRLAFRVPPGSNLGYGRIVLRAGGAEHLHAFQVNEFRRPEFEATATADPGPHLVGGAA